MPVTTRAQYREWYNRLVRPFGTYPRGILKPPRTVPWPINGKAEQLPQAIAVRIEPFHPIGYRAIPDRSRGHRPFKWSEHRLVTDPAEIYFIFHLFDDE